MCTSASFLHTLLLKSPEKPACFPSPGPYKKNVIVVSASVWKFMKVKKLFFRDASLPTAGNQSERFHAVATGCWPLETLHAEQQNGRPSTD